MGVHGPKLPRTPKHGTRTEFGELLAVDLHKQHPVEQQEQFVRFGTLLDERSALLDAADVGRGTATHDPILELTLEFGLDGGDERR